MDQYSTCDVPQMINISIDPQSHPATVTIDGNVINNLSGLAVETEGDNIDYAIVTFKIRVRADALVFHAKQEKSFHQLKRQPGA